MLKGMGVGAIIKLVLAIMIASLFISISTVGSIGQALSQSFEDIERVSGDRGVQIENAEDLGWVLALTRDRALNRGCEIVQERNEQNGGYPGLQGSYLTETPPCYGGEAGLLRGVDGVINQGGLGVDENFMAGIYSREQIEITENITFDPDDVAVEGEDKESIGGLFQGDPRANADNVEVSSGGSIEIAAGAAAGAGGGAAAGFAVGGPAGALVGGVVGGIIGGIAGNFADDQPDLAHPLLFFEEGSVFDRSSYQESDFDSSDDVDEISDEEITLCEGDEGYVQANRGDIDEYGKSSESPLIPIIVIDDIQYETC